MASLTLPYSDGIATGGVVVDIHCEGGGTSLRGRSSGVSPGPQHVDRKHPPAHPGTGVVGQADSGGTGVAGYGYDGGTGVYGTSTNGGHAMNAHGPTTQLLSAGGWMKALAHVSHPRHSLPAIDRSFNSQNDHPFVVYLAMDPGIYVIDFGFTVSDRFVNVTLDARHAFLTPGVNGPLTTWVIGNPGDLEPDGTDEIHDTYAQSPNVALAHAAIIAPTMVQVECFTLLDQPGGGASTVQYKRANHNFFIALY